MIVTCDDISFEGVVVDSRAQVDDVQLVLLGDQPLYVLLDVLGSQEPAQACGQQKSQANKKDKDFAKH